MHPSASPPRPRLLLTVALATTLAAQTKPRARDLGVPFDGTPGPNNAITDVKGVEVGHTTLISGEGKLDSRQRPGPHRRHRHSPSRQGQ